MACLGAGLAKIHLQINLPDPSWLLQLLHAPDPFKLRLLPVPIYPKASRHALLSPTSNRRSDVALEDLAKLVAPSPHASCRCYRGNKPVGPLLADAALSGPFD